MKKTVKTQPIADPSTEERIKNAARELFHKKGFAATKTRDIATAAGINLALLNYYFRSKEKLFDLIMLESLKGFFASLNDVFNHEETSLDLKVEAMVNGYIELLIKNPEIPLFLLSELRTRPNQLMDKVGMKEIVMKSFFIKQFRKGVKEGKYPSINPLHLIMNLIGMTVFPFIASPVIKGMGDLSQKEFTDLMLQRKELIPIWIKAILKTK